MADNLTQYNGSTDDTNELFTKSFQVLADIVANKIKCSARNIEDACYYSLKCSSNSGVSFDEVLSQLEVLNSPSIITIIMTRI